MTPQQQRYSTLLQKSKGATRFRIALTPWVREIVSNYRIGNSTAIAEAKILLRSIYREQYYQTAKQVLNFDVREYKIEEDNFLSGIYKRVSRTLAAIFPARIDKQVFEVMGTADKWIDRTSELAIIYAWGQTEADAALTNYLTNQKLTVSITESGWIVEAVRKTAIVEVADPLKNSIQQIADLIAQEDYNGANRLSRAIVKLTKLPLSESQGDFIRAVNDNRDRLLTPITQGEAVANLQRRASKLDATEKVWRISGFNTRETHQSANGQKKPIAEPFQLSGGLLQYPMDASLGASLNEIINCNCYTEYR
jgi:hypothetical protein